MLGDFREAMSWLNLVESIGGTIPDELIDRRRAWAEQAA